MQKIYEEQVAFLTKYLTSKGVDLKNLTTEQILHYTKEYILCATAELHEVLDEFSWKSHRIEVKEHIPSNVLEELIDVFKYLLNIAIVNKFTSEEFVEKFYSKSFIVNLRYEQDLQLVQISKSDKEFVVVDIDGVLNNYPQNVCDFMAEHSDKFSEDLMQFKQDEYIEYKKLKALYRTSGGELSCRPKNIQELNDLQSRYGVILLSSRPVNKYSRLYYDTLGWLKLHGFKYDFIFFSNEKEDFIIDYLHSFNIKCVIDDQIDNYKKLHKLFNTYLYENNNLYPEETFNNFTTIKSLADV